MAATYLRSFNFEADLTSFPTDAGGQIVADQRPVALEIDTTRRAVFLALSSHIHDALRKAKCGFGDRPIRDVAVCLSSTPRPAPVPDFRHGRLDVDIACDPKDLLTLGPDNGTRGAWAIAAAGRALDKLLDWDADFPADAVRAGIDAFRDSGHAFAFVAGECMIPGTRVKGRINVVVSCHDTRRYFTALLRGAPLFQVALPAIDHPDIQLSNHLPGFSLDGCRLTIEPHKFWPLSEERRPEHMKAVTIDLRDHPVAFATLTEKGWIAPSVED